MSTFYLAVYDSSWRNDEDQSYWSWHDENIPKNSLTLAWNGIRRALVGESTQGDAFADRNRETEYLGIVTLDREWYCYFRIVEAGKDGRGRPGRNVVLCAFIQRVAASGQNPESVWRCQAFDELSRLAPEKVPIPSLSDTKIAIASKSVELDENTSRRLTELGQIRYPEDVVWDQFCAACGGLPNETLWTVLVQLHRDSRTGTIRSMPMAPDRNHLGDRKSVAPPVRPPRSKQRTTSVTSWPKMGSRFVWGVVVIGVLVSAILFSTWKYSIMTAAPFDASSGGNGGVAGPGPGFTPVIPTSRQSPSTDRREGLYVSPLLLVLVIFTSSLAFLLGLVLGNLTRIYFGWQIPLNTQRSGIRDRDPP